MALTVIRNDTHFRLESQDFCTSCLSDAAENRTAMVVLLRLLADDNGKAWFAHQPLRTLPKKLKILLTKNSSKYILHDVLTEIKCAFEQFQQFLSLLK